MPGGGEFLLILLVVLMLFGGKELPKVARMFGKWTSTMRRSMNEIRQELNRVAIADELKEAEKQVKSVKEDIVQARKDFEKDIFTDMKNKEKDAETEQQGKSE